MTRCKMSCGAKHCNVAAEVSRHTRIHRRARLPRRAFCAWRWRPRARPASKPRLDDVASTPVARRAAAHTTRAHKLHYPRGLDAQNRASGFSRHEGHDEGPPHRSTQIPDPDQAAPLHASVLLPPTRQTAMPDNEFCPDSNISVTRGDKSAARSETQRQSWRCFYPALLSGWA